jgi:N-dimethylarginine dimethylaminohydrolase
MPARFLMCPPTHFGVEYVINPWMRGNVGRAVRRPALEEWARLHAAVACEGEVALLPARRGLPDLPFVANAGLVHAGTVVPARLRCPERRGEEAHFRRWFARAGLRIVPLDEGLFFEGEGDALFQPGEPLLWAGWGMRSSRGAPEALARVFDVEVEALRLVDARFYHLDTCLAPLPGGRLIYYPPAFDAASQAAIARRVPAERRLAVSEWDALRFVCNAVPIGATLFCHDASERFHARMAAWGLAVRHTPLASFLYAGGASKCLVLRLEQEAPAPAADAQASRLA